MFLFCSHGVKALGPVPRQEFFRTSFRCSVRVSLREAPRSRDPGPAAMIGASASALFRCRAGRTRNPARCRSAPTSALRSSGSIREFRPWLPSRLPWSAFASPAAIEASGLRRSWPSTAMNCSRKLRSFALAQKPGLAGGQPIHRLEMDRNQFREQLEHADRLRRIQPRRPRIERAQGAEEGPVGENDGHRDVALEPEFRRGVMSAVGGVFGDVVDDDGLVASAGSRGTGWSRPQALRRARDRTRFRRAPRSKPSAAR